MVLGDIIEQRRLMLAVIAGLRIWAVALRISKMAIVNDYIHGVIAGAGNHGTVSILSDLCTGDGS